MKILITINLLLLLLPTALQAAPISIGIYNDIYVANTLLGSSNSIACEAEAVATRTNCDFVKTVPITALNNSGLAEIVTTNPATYVASPDRLSTSFDLGFDGFDLFTGEGNDLIVFMVGNNFSFGLDVFDVNGGNISTGTYDVTVANTVFDKDGYWLCVNGTVDVCGGGLPLSARLFDIGNDGTKIGSIRISLGESYKGDDGSRPRFSLAGGFHNESIAAVPLPLSSILFSSGLALLGWFGRKKTA